MLKILVLLLITLSFSQDYTDLSVFDTAVKSNSLRRLLCQ